MKKKVLVFPAGTEIGLEIYRSLRYSKFVEIYGGTSASDHSEFIYERLIAGFPYVGDGKFIDYLNEIINEYGIDCVFPAHDDVLVVLSDNRMRINAQVIATDINTVKTCRSKKRTYEKIKNSWYVPTVYSPYHPHFDFPIFLKPDIGQGSKGAMLINTTEELTKAIKNNPDVVLTEYLPGEEYTVDCFTDNDGRILSNKMRSRDRTINGISARSVNMQATEEVNKIAADLNRTFDFKGAWFFQLKEDTEGALKLLEVSPRIPGTVGVSRNQGINYEMLTLFVFWGYTVSLIDNGYSIKLDRSLKSLYKVELEYNYVYLDYDDTVIINNKVNKELLYFLYQCINNNKRLVLLTKHSGDVVADMLKHKISPILFDEIIRLGENENKQDYIKHTDSIFIDDSFAEREKVKEKTGINVFDLDMVECLIEP